MKILNITRNIGYGRGKGNKIPRQALIIFMEKILSWFSNFKIMKQFLLPSEKAPEEYIYNMLIELQEDDPIIKHARTLHAVADSHDWLNELTYKFGQSEEWILSEIMKEND